jgi:uncharacterized damage-inducible protein DinB
VNTMPQDLIEHHIWANDTLLDYCEGLDTEALALTAPGTFGTVEETFVHVAANEEGYLNELHAAGVTGEMRPTIFEGDVPRELATVRPVLARTANGWRALVRDWPQNAVREFTDDGEVEQLPISVFVTQVINHATEHRAHIRTILSANDLNPPEIDAWHWSEAVSSQGGAQ